MTIRNKIIMSLAQRSMAANKQQIPAKTRPRTRARIKPSVIAIYASTFLLIVAMVFIGCHEPQNLSVVANAIDTNSPTKINQTSVDDAVATSVVANVAQVANLPIATSATNLAISAQTKSQYTQTDGSSATKPQIIRSPIDRDIISYTVVSGDTADLVAAKYNISKQTIKWANNLTTDTLVPGTVLRILPVDGVIYNVKPGDTIDTIATKYNVDKTRLVLYNDLEVSGLTPNTSIILPSAILPDGERPGYVAARVNIATNNTHNYYYGGRGAGFGGKTWYISSGTPDDGNYSHGNCTLYASNRRKALGLRVEAHWGNAGSWATLAAADGLLVNHNPSVGAIIQEWGHVGIVESILPNGDLSISEMNAYVSGGGYNIVSGRIIPAGNIGQYWFIH